ncbi:MAG: hypothetical protein IPO27_08730 [Bacteroidetes bacterium]|nr:hypothetical protein [Bacteroidota bacterium]
MLAVPKLPAQESIVKQSRLYDVKHLVLNLIFDLAKKNSTGTCKITLTPTTDLDYIVLDAVDHSFQKIIIDDEKLLFDYQTPDLTKNSKKHFKKNTPVTVTIYYHTNHVNEINPTVLSGSNANGLRFSQPASKDPLKPKEVYSSGEFRGNRYWYPCNENPAGRPYMLTRNLKLLSCLPIFFLNFVRNSSGIRLY